jgi:hypothetical protein
MQRVKSKVVVRLVKTEFPESPWEKPYIGQVGDVEWIDTAIWSQFQIRIRFPEEIDLQVFGRRLDDGFLTFSRNVEVLEGDLAQAYYGTE